MFEKKYLCINLTLLTEPASAALESIYFVLKDVLAYTTPDPRVFLYLTSNTNLDIGVAVVGFYNTSESALQIEARVFFNGTVASTGTVSYDRSIRVKRYSDELVIENSVHAEQRLPGLENLADLDLDRLCFGGGAASLRRPTEGKLSRLFVNRINVLREGRIFDEVNIDLNSVRFLTPESRYAATGCTQSDFVMDLSFSFVTYDRDAVLATFTTDDQSRSLTFKIVNSEMKISLGDDVAVLLDDVGENKVQNVSNGRKYTVTMFLLSILHENQIGLGVLITGADIISNYVIPFPLDEILTVCTNGMTLGENYVGCVQDLKFGFDDSPAYNFSLEGLLGVANRRCLDPCEAEAVHCEASTCLALSETEYRCPGKKSL